MSTFVAEINKLRNMQQNLERNESVLVEQISKIEESSQICDFFKESTTRVAQAEKMQNDVKGILVPLRKVNNLVRQENINNIDVKLVKKEMTTIQNNIQNLKDTTKTSLEVLRKEEEKLCEEMQTFEAKIQDWSKPSIANSFRPNVVKKTSTTTPKNISQEVKDFMEYVTAHGGHENGWTPDDHNLFLKARGKTKDVNKLAEMLNAILPDISEEEVIAHEKWYTKYIVLKEKQKNAITNWRNSKLNTKKTTPPKDAKSDRNILKAYSEYFNKEDVQQKISAWKAKKRAQTRNQYEQKLQDELKQKQLQKEEQQKHKQIKAEVNNWRHARKTAEDTEKLQKEISELRDRENRAARANKLIKQYQSQDEVFIQRKIQMRQIRPKSAEVEVVKIKHEAPRDPGRLLRPTKQWIIRTYGSDNSGSENNKLHLQAIPKLRIPEWRKSIV